MFCVDSECQVVLRMHAPFICDFTMIFTGIVGITAGKPAEFFSFHYNQNALKSASRKSFETKIHCITKVETKKHYNLVEPQKNRCSVINF